MTTLLIEIGTEEIPARFCPALLAQIEERAKTTLAEAGVTPESIEIVGTYRRLALIIKGLPTQQPDVTHIQKGPAITAGDKAAEGFARKWGLAPDQLTQENIDGKSIWVANVFQKGRLVSNLVPEWTRAIFGELNLPIAMRWGNAKDSFIRPVQWICCLFGDNAISFEWMGIQSSNQTRTHRFLGNPTPDSLGKPLALKDAEAYAWELEQHNVQVDLTKRKAMIQTSLPDTVDTGLLEEVTWLTEWPEVLEGQFDSSYLDIPAEVLVEVMKKHQKYFPSYQDNQLQNTFYVVADNVTELSQKNIIQGNESVLRARLEDAKFFWDEDRKHPLEFYLEKLKTVTFQKGLGSVYDKVERIRKLAKEICSMLSYPHTDEVDRVARLCKADLATHMVAELPELQGIMGMHYANSKAIFEHYLPRNLQDNNRLTTQSMEAAIVGIADRIDTIVCCFWSGLIPTGSKDPWGVRRSANGLFAIMLAHNLSLDLNILTQTTWKILGKEQKNGTELISFLTERVAYALKLSGFPDDLIAFTGQHHLSNLKFAVQLMPETIEFRRQAGELINSIREMAVRVSRLSKKSDKTSKVNPDLFIEEIEKISWKAFQEIKDRHIWVGPAIGELSSYIEKLNTYFEKVMVMTEDPALQANRLAFLAEVNSVFQKWGDFEKLQ